MHKLTSTLFLSIFSLALTIDCYATTDGPSFEESRNWIMGKVQQYDDTYKQFVGKYANKYDAKSFIIYNKNGASDFSISECRMSSNITYYRKFYDHNYGDDRKRNESELEFSGFDISEISSVSFKLMKMFGYDHYEARGEIPVLRISFNYDVGTYSHYKALRSKKEYKWSPEDAPRNYMYVYFRYQNQEKDLISRLEKAFLHLKDLARNNPACGSSKETF